MKRLTHKYGFTLMELMVVIIIIAILAAIAVPQYKKAVLKSRFSTMMPMAKSIADAQEVYYQGRQMYALDVDELDVTPVTAENTTVTLGDEEKFNYVMAQRSDVPGNRYVMYQKHSINFPGNIHCEALTGDTQAEQLCQALGGENIGENGNYTAYLLFGDGINGNFDKECKSTAETEQACSGGCGIATREAECDTRTGEWTYGEWSECPGKPAESQECSKNNKNGMQTRSVTCNTEGTAWETGSWSTCDIPCTGSKPKDITTFTSNATGTAECVEGEWKYTWTRTVRNGSCSATSERRQYDCAGAIYQENATYCNGYTSGSALNVIYACTGSIFQGAYSNCSAWHPYDCADTSYTGRGSYCLGQRVNGCAGSTFAPETYCYAASAGGCDGVIYQRGEDSEGNPTSSCCLSSGGNYCPVGSPKCTVSYVGQFRNASWNGKCWGEGGTEVDCED